MDFQNDFDHSFPFPELWMELSQCHWDWTISDPPAGAPTTPSYTYPLQAAEIPLELLQTSHASQIPHDQEMADPSYDIPDIGRTPIVDVGVGPNVIESPLNRRPTRKRSTGLTKRRALKAQKSKRIDEIRTIVGMNCKASKLEVLNAAVQHLGGTVPQSAPANRDERTKLAYEALHERTGSQGRLRHVQCLELVIKALKGLPTLNPIFAGQPSGST